MIISIIIAFFCICIFFLLCTPIFFEIDSARRLLQVRIWGIGSAQLLIRDSKIGIGLNIMGWKKLILPGTNSKTKAAPKKKKGFTMKRSTLKKLPRKILAVLRSFRVELFYLNLDTDDYVTNALLYPVATMLSRNGRHISINFQGEVELRLTIQNNLQRMLRAYLFT